MCRSASVSVSAAGLRALFDGPVRHERAGTELRRQHADGKRRLAAITPMESAMLANDIGPARSSRPGSHREQLPKSARCTVVAARVAAAA